MRYSKNCLRETSNYGDSWWITTAPTAFLFILCAVAFYSVGINTLTHSYIRKHTQKRIKMNLMVEYAVALLFEFTFSVGFHFFFRVCFRFDNIHEDVFIDFKEKMKFHKNGCASL